jgi:cytochrome c
MKRAVILLGILAMTSVVMAMDGISVERGKELFSGAELGTNGKSCISCHRDGEGLAKAALYDDENLGVAINRCIQDALEGEMLDDHSAGMKSLIMYIKSLVPYAHQ